ncbi:UDP-3-O-(3-hydroxymyristoyl)glucosamine N-acyltransferase, partial [Vibrio cholerae]
MLSVSEIAQSLSGRVEGDASLIVETIRPVVSDIHGGLAIVFARS